MALSVGIEVLLVRWAHCSPGENSPGGVVERVALQLGIASFVAHCRPWGNFPQHSVVRMILLLEIEIPSICLDSQEDNIPLVV